jgi:branched-chain amino acid transport system substrate-binding protein
VSRRVVVAVTVAALLACATTGHAQTPPIRLGWIGNVTGPAAVTCVPVRDGLMKYIEQVNKGGGVKGRKIEVAWRDDQGKPDVGLNVARELVEKEKVFAMVGTCGTPTSSAMRDYVRSARVLHFGPISEDDRLGDPGAAGPTSFRLLPSQKHLMRNAVSYLRNVLKIPEKDVALLAANSDMPVARVGEQLLKSRGSTFGLLEMAANLGTFDAALNTVRQRRPRAVISVYNLAAVAQKVESDDSLRSPVWVFAGFDARSLSHGHSVVITPVPFPSASSPGVKEFRDATKSENVAALAGWVIAKVFVEGLRRAPEISTDSTVKALESLKKWDTGVIGGVTYSDKDHQGRTGGVATETKDGKTAAANQQLADACCEDCKPQCEDSCCNEKCKN